MSIFTSLFNISRTYLTIVSHLLQLNEKNIETNLLEEYVYFVDVTKKQNENFKLILILFVVILCLFLFSVLFNYLNEQLLFSEYKLNLMADFMRVKNENPRMKLSQLANQLGMSSSTIQRYRNDINMLSPYTINPNNTKKRSKKALNTYFNDDSHHEVDVKRAQMSPNVVERPQSTSNENSKKAKTKNNLKAGSIQKDIETNEHYLDNILKHNKT